MGIYGVIRTAHRVIWGYLGLYGQPTGLYGQSIELYGQPIELYGGIWGHMDSP